MSRLSRRVVAAPALVLALAAGTLAATAAPALADNAKTLTVVGTSDVFDSNLIQAVIKPGFEAKYPGITLNYVSQGTGAAIAYAEAGSASALVVHAASLENQFVAQGYSLETYGRAIFYGDYVLLGPAADPAGVKRFAPHDIVGAFQRIAKAGLQGQADFVSRGGTPGTTVQEHALWNLTTGVPLCQVSTTNGGGKAPSTTSGDCPTTATNPSWYHTTGLNQGLNILNGDSCNYGHGNDCYVFTDRGTFQYLRSTGQISNLQVVTSVNSPGKPGGDTALVNSFHAYGVNPAKFSDKPNVKINSSGALKFLDYITSPEAQQAVGAYLTDDPDGAPFLPSAAPQISTSVRAPAADGSVTITGSVVNVVPGTPALNGVTVKLNYRPSADGGTPVNGVASTVTDPNGKFKFVVKPTATGTYTVSSPAITKVENSTLTPIFADLLQASVSEPTDPVAAKGTVTFRTLTPVPGAIRGSAGFTPGDTIKPGQLQLWAAQGTDDLAPVGSPLTIPVGNTTLPYRFSLAPGDWRVQLHYVNDGVITEGVSDVKTVTVTS